MIFISQSQVDEFMCIRVGRIVSLWSQHLSLDFFIKAPISIENIPNKCCDHIGAPDDELEALSRHSFCEKCLF